MRSKDVFTLIALAAVWGASFLFLRVAAPVVGPVAVAAGRVSIAAVLLLPWVWRRRELGPLWHQARPLAVAAFLACVLPALCLGEAARTLPAGLMSILNATTPMWGALIGWLWAKERLSRARLIGLISGLVGVAMLSIDQAHVMPQSALPDALRASGLVLLATLSYAFSVHHAQRHLPTLSPLGISAGTMAISSLVLSGPALSLGPVGVPSGSWLDTPHVVWWSLLALGAACTALAYVTFFRLIQRIGPSRALTVTFLIPVFGMLWGALLLNESITPLMMMSTAIIGWGTWLSNRTPS
ncbi:MAG: DMT family transporter [Burkholderiales bacterium]|nr:DMT family transporter [Burkholderiales bacterium]MBH2017059.1 DMT family transporter [Burkholderiales bacterium]